MNGKVVILGLDGATFDVIKPLIKEGHLPNLKYLLDNGAYGELESTFPPVTAAAWMSIATGKNPGKTGVFTFRNRRDDDLKLYPLSSNDYVANGALWDYLSKSGFKVGILNYPGLYPPYPINGFMVGGVGTPEKNICYPKSFEKELDRVTGGYEISIPINSPKYKNKEDKFIKNIEKLIAKRKKAINYILKNKKIDILILVLPESDFIQHYLYKYWDDNYPGIDENKKKKYKREFIRLWDKIDEIVGDVVEHIYTDDYLFVISDHGFGRLTKGFRINQWLINEGYLKLKRNYGTKRESIFYNIFNKLEDRKIRGYLRYFKNKFKKIPFVDSFENFIDYENSLAIAFQYSGVGGIEILNHDQKLREEISIKLINFVNNHPLLSNIELYRPNDIYIGDKLDNFPDIIFLIDECEVEILANSFGSNIVINGTTGNRSGDHRRYGIFIGFSSNIRHINIKNAKIFDITPTIFYILGLRPSNDIDGRILKEIFISTQFNSKNLPQVVSDKSKMAFRRDDEEIKKKLKDLGYL